MAGERETRLRRIAKLYSVYAACQRCEAKATRPCRDQFRYITDNPCPGREKIGEAHDA